MEQNKQPMIFISGMGFKPRAENAPETVRGAIYFKWTEFRKFCDENVDEKGYVNVKMMKSKQKGSIYFILDTYKPKAQLSDEQKQTYENRYTSPSPEFPKGVDAYNHPLTTDKEREEMEARDVLETLDQIPF